eukprot:CAMPEP_0201594072 /NCGR_PEP_ID=MMETSP0190_2-20130828/191499_1 /ASSEMBLY_ACC=CAM_ASM_000263 /TAXON_ID=37353 /ORGANISM="Rosalina sp." /LENGTH=132 /DNA_ID=CAMNT_0048053539 /DNA_START=88 /DNA_END=483 /DNA_ORIENTATION=-
MAHEDDGVGFDMIGAITTEKEQIKQDEEIAEFEQMLKKKKKKKKKKKGKKSSKSSTTTEKGDEVKAVDDSSNKDSLNDTYFKQADERDYPYTVLLDRIFSKLNENNANLMTKQSHTLPPPQTALHGSKKTGW